MALQKGVAFLHVRTFGPWVDGLSSKDNEDKFPLYSVPDLAGSR